MLAALSTLSISVYQTSGTSLGSTATSTLVIHHTISSSCLEPSCHDCVPNLGCETGNPATVLILPADLL